MVAIVIALFVFTYLFIKLVPSRGASGSQCSARALYVHDAMCDCAVPVFAWNCIFELTYWAAHQNFVLGNIWSSAALYGWRYALIASWSLSRLIETARDEALHRRVVGAAHLDAEALGVGLDVDERRHLLEHPQGRRTRSSKRRMSSDSRAKKRSQRLMCIEYIEWTSGVK